MAAANIAKPVVYLLPMKIGNCGAGWFVFEIAINQFALGWLVPNATVASIASAEGLVPVVIVNEPAISVELVPEDAVAPVPAHFNPETVA